MFGALNEILLPQPLHEKNYTSSYTCETGERLQPGECGSLYGYSFEWSPRLGERSVIRIGYYKTRAEADDVFTRALAGMNYTPPRWWQWWRWGEYLPPKRA